MLAEVLVEVLVEAPDLVLAEVLDGSVASNYLLILVLVLICAAGVLVAAMAEILR